MTQERLTEITQMLEAWKATDAHAGDAEKTSVVEELLAEHICPTASKISQGSAGLGSNRKNGSKEKSGSDN